MFEDYQVIWSALRDYEESKSIRGKRQDFADALIANKAHYVAAGKGLSCRVSIPLARIPSS